MLNRAQYPNGLSAPTVRALEALLVVIGPQKQARALDGPPQKKRCMVCPRISDRKVRQQCKECKRNVCKEHSKTILMQCANIILLNKNVLFLHMLMLIQKHVSHLLSFLFMYLRI